MSDHIDARILKLPRWAQDHIDNVERSRDYYRRVALNGVTGEFNVSQKLSYPDERPLGQDIPITFHLPPEEDFPNHKRWVEVLHVVPRHTTTAGEEPGRIEIRGSDRLIVHLDSSNRLFVEVAPL